MNNKVFGLIAPLAILIFGIWGLSHVGEPLRSYIDTLLAVLGIVWCLYLYFKWRVEYYAWATQMLLLSFCIGLFYLWVNLLEYFPLEGIYAVAIRAIIILFGIVLMVMLFTFDWWKPKLKKTWMEFGVGELLSLYIFAGKRMEVAYLSDQDSSEKIKEASGQAWGIYLELKRRGQEWRLKDFLNYKENGVKFITARHLLWMAEPDSLRVLDELGKLKNDLGRDARECAKAWRAKEISQDINLPDELPGSGVLWGKIRDICLTLCPIIAIGLAIFLMYLNLTYKPPIYSGYQPSGPDDLYGFVVDSIQEHASSSISLSYASSTNYWGTKEGYLVPLDGYELYAPYFHTLTDASTSEAVANLTQYTEQLLTNYGFQPDPYNTSTSTDSGPFYRLRTGFVSSDGMLHCFIQSPERWQYLSQWYFECALTHDITATLQVDMPYLKALGYPKGAAVFPWVEGNFASVGVGDEIESFYNAILIKNGDEWNAIYSVPGLPPCSLIQQYAVPQSVFGSCKDANTI